MSHPKLSRRDLLTSTTGALLGSTLAPALSAGAAEPTPEGNTSPKGLYRLCFNTSTIRGQQLPLDQQVKITAQAGYQAIEPWIRDIEAYRDSGKSLSDLKKKISDLGLTVESAIGFAQWIVDEENTRKQGLEQAKRDMDLLKQIGGVRIAAPPTGATNQSDLNLFAAAERYRALLEIGEQIGVIPQVEVWGFSKSLSRLGESVFVAIESGHPKACLLPDVYHVYKGGSDFAGLNLLSGSCVQVFHINDYPADPPRETIKDADRVYPGDGVAPLNSILQMLHQNGCHCVLSLELFNPEYWKQDALTVARTGREKIQSALDRAFPG